MKSHGSAKKSQNLMRLSNSRSFCNTMSTVCFLFFRIPALASTKFLMNVNRSEFLIKAATKSPRLASTASDLTVKYGLTFYDLYTFVDIMLSPTTRHSWKKKQKTLTIQPTNPGRSIILITIRSHTSLFLISPPLSSFPLQNGNAS